MEKPIRYGVIGIGGMGGNHAKKLQENKIENAILTAVADSNVEYKNKYENIPFFENIYNFFDNKIIDAAIIATISGSFWKSYSSTVAIICVSRLKFL